ncbi:MipA/OmpV family protein [Stenotrophomonas sp. 24(2023)]|uniref:MipA/OmpV family protein n=1 Tax=Stenotrophomonas sp. 24(2023) TaxID=3068324 RepID=UPI0027DEC323|nr:MipA/OmpV family protein [Stenotrophomonas sp. 24(2023)]WMJ69349.1 MipA/OmpV family protein [Stenotrophomonas sp. 24(2023)]
MVRPYAFASLRRRRPRLLPRPLLLVVALLAMPLARAEDTPAPARAVGVAVASLQPPYRAADRRTLLLPVLRYDNRWLAVSGPQLDLKVRDGDAMYLRARLRYEPGLGYEASDSPVLAGMRDRRAGLWAGPVVGGALGRTQWQLEALADVGGASGGRQVVASLRHPYRLGQFQLTPRVEAGWVDADYADYYMGVRPEEAAPGRAAYAPGSSGFWRAGLRLERRIGRRQSIGLDLAATRLGGALRDSPIVDDRLLTTLSLGYLVDF